MSTHPSADAEPGDVNAIDPELNPESPQLGESPLSLPNDLQQQRNEIELHQNEETHALEIQLMQLEIEEKRLEIKEKQIQLARKQEDDRLDLKYRQETELDRYYEARRVQNQRIRVQMVELYARLIMGFSAFGLGAYLTLSGNPFGSLPLGAGFASVGIQLGQATKLTRILSDKTLSTADQEDNDES